MKHFILFYEVAPDYVARRGQYRTEHLTKAWAASQRGELLLGGAFADATEGAALLFRGESKKVAEDFANVDPYVTSGAVTRWYVREWVTVAGDDAMTPVYPEGAASSAKTPATAQSSKEILRMWKAHATAAKAGDYARHASEKVFPELRALPGHRGAYLLHRSVGNTIEFLVLTLWASMDAVRGFAGPQPEKSVVEPAARAVLSDFDETAEHYEVVVHTGEGV